MIATDELIGNLRAALRLLLGDRAAQAAFDVSLDGFWHSFRVMALLAPTALASILADHALAHAAAEGAPIGPRLVAGALAYGLGWIAFPLLLALLARPFDLGPVYVPWMVARNWTSIPAALPAFVVTLAWLLGVLPTGLLGVASLAALGFSLYCAFVVARLVAGLGVAPAVGFVLLDFLLSMLVEGGLDRLFDL
jgi:hypothetical protein